MTRRQQVSDSKKLYQFPEWLTVEAAMPYEVRGVSGGAARTLTGAQLELAVTLKPALANRPTVATLVP